ncbi:MAG: glycosyltransferase family 9 protein, partial [Acidimicrobiia bacterium]|nr:glycosyltransferase family 9 protein [Acidimicrobiia bacterium]
MTRPQQLQSDRGNPRLKFLDRYVGIPIVAVLGVVRRVRGRRAIPSDWHTVGLLLTAGIGDTVVATGILRDLRAAYPRARIVLFVTANNASFARLLTTPDTVVELPVRQLPTAVRAVRAEQCDVVVDLSAWRRFDAVLAALSGAKVTIGLRTAGQHRHFGHDIVVDHQTDHEIENDRRLVATLGVQSRSEPMLGTPADRTTLFVAPYVALHLWPGGANFEERSWPIANWSELARALNDRGLDVVLTGGPGDIDVTEDLVAAWRTAGIRAQNAAGGTWPASLVVLSGATGLISVNSGVMHVGA